MARNLRRHRIYDAASTESRSLTQTLITQEPSGGLAHSCSNLTLFIKRVTVNRRVLSEWQFNFRHLNYPLVFKRGANTGEGRWLRWYFHSQRCISGLSPRYILTTKSKGNVCLVDYFVTCWWFVYFPFGWCHISNMHLREEPENLPHLLCAIARQPISVANSPRLFGGLDSQFFFVVDAWRLPTTSWYLSQPADKVVLVTIAQTARPSVE